MNSEYIDTSEFQFKGKHAEYVSRLTSEFDKNKFKVFNRNIDVLIFSSIVGFLYNRRAEIDNNNEIRPVKINFQQLTREQNILEYNYQLIMLLYNKESIENEERLNRAFRYVDDREKRKVGDEVYLSFVLGGVEVLYEKILENTSNPEEIINNMYCFIKELNERYNQDIDEDILRNLCNNAKRNQL